MCLKSENNIVVTALIHYCVDGLKFYRVKKWLKKNIYYFFLKGSYVITKKLLLYFVVMVYFYLLFASSSCGIWIGLWKACAICYRKREYKRHNPFPSDTWFSWILMVKLCIFFLFSYCSQPQHLFFYLSCSSSP